MGLYIKGAKMPKSCWFCPCYNKEYLICQVTDTPCECEYDDYEKPDNCPLVKIPLKHGRLVDANEVQSWISSGGLNVENIPTVLEAEGEEENHYATLTMGLVQQQRKHEEEI